MIRRRGQVILVLLCLWMLAVALPTVRVAPGPLASLEFSQAGDALPQEVQGSKLLLKTILFAYAAVLGILVFLSWWKTRRRKPEDVVISRQYPSLMRPWLAAALLAFVFAFVGGAVWWATHQPSAVESARLHGPMMGLEREPTPAIQPSFSQENQQTPKPAVPLWVVYLLLTSALGVVGWGVWRILDKSSEPSEPPGQIRPDRLDIGPLAARAVNDLQKDAVTADVVLRCYLDMCHIFRKKVKMRREMTAREFVKSLEREGVRQQEVKRLTSLFEKVRYGRHAAGPEDRAEAIALLKALGHQYGEPSREV